MVVMTAFKEQHGACRREILLHSDTKAGSLLLAQLGKFFRFEIRTEEHARFGSRTFLRTAKYLDLRNINAQQIVVVLRGLGVH